MSAESITNEEEVIVFPIRFAVDPQNVEEVQNAIDGGEGGESAEKKKSEMTPEQERKEEALKQMEEFLRTTDQQGLKVLSNFAKNPGGAVEGQLMGLLSKAGIPGIIATAVIGLIIAAPELIMTISKALAVKGGPLNQDFHLYFDEQGQLGFTREVQYRKAVGLDVVITNNERGFLLTDPDFVTNSLLDIDTTRSIRTSSKEQVYGYVGSM